MPVHFKWRCYSNTCVIASGKTLIAAHHYMSLVRGSIGDIFVIPHIYTFVRSIFGINGNSLPWANLKFSGIVELTQLFSLAELIDAKSDSGICIILGKH